MLNIFRNRRAKRKESRMPYSFGFAPIIVGLLGMGLGLWRLLESDGGLPGAYWTGMTMCAGFVISGIVGLIFVWRVNRPDHDVDMP